MRELWKHFEIMERELNLDKCGIHQFERGEHYEYNAYQNFVLHYIEEGEGTYIVDDTTYFLSKGDGFIVKKGNYVHYKSLNAAPMKNYWVGLSGSVLDATLLHTSLNQSVKITFNDKSLIPEIIKDICHATLKDKNHEMHDFWYLSKLYKLLLCITEEYNMKSMDGELIIDQNNYGEVAYHFIYKNYMHKVSMEEVAHSIGISRSHLYRCFKEAYNLSPQQYITKLRMETASSLLQDTKDKIKIIAEKVGYHNQLQFSSKFKEYFGVSPSKYRQLKKELGYRMK